MIDRTAIDILGVRVDACDVGALQAAIARFVDTRAHALVLNVNAHALNLAYSRTWLRDLFNEAPVVFCDGAGVRLAAWLLGRTLPPRITYADWMWQLAEFAAGRGYRLFLLGGRAGVAQGAAAALQAAYPGLHIVGTHHGFFCRAANSPANLAVVTAINTAQPDILVVCFGMPAQERWLLENWDRLNAQVALTGGAALDYVSGTLRRPPVWMTRNGLEWLGRLLIEPGRLWRRYLIGNPLFLWRVLRQRRSGANR